MPHKPNTGLLVINNSDDPSQHVVMRMPKIADLDESAWDAVTDPDGVTYLFDVKFVRDANNILSGVLEAHS